jgi:hypothetical protein
MVSCRCRNHMRGRAAEPDAPYKTVSGKTVAGEAVALYGTVKLTADLMIKRETLDGRERR